MGFKSLFLMISIYSGLAGAAPTDIQTCNAWSSQDWDTFIASNLLSSIETQPPQSIIRAVESAKATCSSSIGRLGISECLSRISGYYRQFSGSIGIPGSGNGNMFSSVMTDQEYYASQPQDRMELPAELRTAANGLPQNWKDIAKQKGWQWALFSSGTGGQPRLVMRIPKNGYTQLLVYYGDSRYPANSDPTTYVGLQMQSIETERNGRRLDKAIINFRSFGFAGQPNNFPHSVVSGGRCITCHTNGPRAIIPQSNPAFPTQFNEGMNLEKFNRSITLTGPIDYSPFYDLRNFPSQMTFGSACIRCHNANSRPLAFSVLENGQFSISQHIRKVLQEKSMPAYPGYSGTAADRDRIAREISSDYYSNLRKWLTEKKCSAISPPPRSSPAPSSWPWPFTGVR